MGEDMRALSPVRARAPLLEHTGHAIRLAWTRADGDTPGADALRTDAGDQHDRISSDPAMMTGKPVVKGTRIPVARVLAHLAQHPALADLPAAYPELTVDDVKASLQDAHQAVERRRRRAGRTEAAGTRPAHG